MHEPQLVAASHETPVTIRRLLGLCPLLLLPIAASDAHGANIFEGVTLFSSPVLTMNPSVRWRALGDAGTAGFWDPAHAWANPALLGLATGIQYETGTSDHDVDEITTARTTLGWGGIGLSTTGSPIRGLGETELEFFGITESVRSWSLGVSTSQVAATIARLRGAEPAAFTRWCDLAIGYTGKRVGSEFSFSGFGEGVSTYEFHSNVHDVGLLFRGRAPVGPLRVDLGYGYAAINTGSPVLGSGGTARDDRNGVAVRAGWDPAVARRRVPGWLRGGTNPLVSVGWAMDFVHRSEFDDTSRGWGAELALANVLFGRIGREEQVHSWGIGAGVPLGRFASIRWDHSSRSRFFGVSDERRDAWIAWLDPLAIFGAVR